MQGQKNFNNPSFHSLLKTAIVFHQCQNSHFVLNTDVTNDQPNIVTLRFYACFSLTDCVNRDERQVFRRQVHFFLSDKGKGVGVGTKRQAFIVVWGLLNYNISSLLLLIF